MTKQMISKELMIEFARLLVDHMGLHYPQEQWNELERKLMRVMVAFGFSDPQSFLQWLKQSPLSREQITLFAQHLTIGETYFFRDARTFTALKEKILPSILENHQSDRHIHIWCAGCCTGEEPYSLAILFHQILANWQDWKIEILGTDINPDFLKKAEYGHYKMWSFRTTPPEIIKKYFIQSTNTTYALIPEIKERVKFAYLNLVEEPDPSQAFHFHNIDLILCHNVLIYFSQYQIKKIIHRFAQSLREHAWLSVSAIEAPFVSHQHLISDYFSGAFFFKKESKRKSAGEAEVSLPVSKKSSQPEKEEDILLKVFPPDFLQSSPSHSPLIDLLLSKEEKKLTSKTEKPAAKNPPNLHTDKSPYEKSLHLSNIKKYDEATSQLLSYLLPYQKDENFIHQHLKEIILLIQIYANQGDGLSALEWIELALQVDKLNPNLYYLHATILHSLGDIPNGIRSLKRALFLDSNFVAAHYLLGILEQTQKNTKAAARHFRIALDLLQNYPEEEILFGTEELTAGYLKDLLLNMLEKS